jgi:hypothetical protein
MIPKRCRVGPTRAVRNRGDIDDRSGGTMAADIICRRSRARRPLNRVLTLMRLKTRGSCFCLRHLGRRGSISAVAAPLRQHSHPSGFSAATD